MLLQWFSIVLVDDLARPISAIRFTALIIVHPNSLYYYYSIHFE